MRAGGGGGAEEGGVGGPEAGGGEATGAGVGRPAWWRFPAPQERPESRCVAGGVGLQPVWLSWDAGRVGFSLGSPL